MTDSRISRVLQVLALVAFAPEPVKLKEIGLRLGLHPSMVSRIVSDLIREGYLAKNAYRSVIATPDLAVLGMKAGRNHPLTKIARQVLHAPMAAQALSCEFATAAKGGLCHFYQVSRGTPAPEPLWRSDLAAVIFAAKGESREKILEDLTLACSSGNEQGFDYFWERFSAAQGKDRLAHYHAGRFRQLTIPVDCGGLICALSVSGNVSTDMDRLFFECSRLAAKIRSLYVNLSVSDA